MHDWIVMASPFISALIGGMFTLVAAKSRLAVLGKKHTRRSVVRLCIAAISLLVIIGLAITTYVTWRPIDRWEHWERTFAHEFAEQRGDGLARLGNALKLVPPPFDRSVGESKSIIFYEDMTFGRTLLQNESIATVLQNKLGIYGNIFTGGGHSLPWKEGYSKATTREYLVPNIKDSDPGMVTWILHPIIENYEKKLSELLFETPPTSPADSNVATRLLELAKGRRLDANKMPPLIRFNKFPKGAYSDRVGRTEASWVFFCNLQDVWDMTVEQAAKSSGFQIRGNDTTDTRLFIWLYLPSHPDGVQIATWRNIKELLIDCATSEQ